jgi:hypothetical protein
VKEVSITKIKDGDWDTMVELAKVLYHPWGQWFKPWWVRNIFFFHQL